MKFAILLLFFLISAKAKDVLSFSELLGEVEATKARRAKLSLDGKDKGDFYIDWYNRHFLLSEKDKIVHIIYIFSNEEIIDGELAFRLTWMFSHEEPAKGKYDADLAKNRFSRIEKIPPERIKSFIRYVGGNFTTYSKNLAQFKGILEIE